MKFGYTTEQKRAIKQLKVVERAIGQYRFAWLPVTVVDGRRIWLEKYYEVSNEFISVDENGNYEARNYSGCYSYAFPHIRDANWRIMKKSQGKHGRPHYSEYDGTSEVLEHLLNFKAELLAKINK